MSLVRDERAELRAGFLNDVGAGCHRGRCPPIIAIVISVPGASDRMTIVVLLGVIWVLGGAFQQLVAQAFLRSLKE